MEEMHSRAHSYSKLSAQGFLLILLRNIGDRLNLGFLHLAYVDLILSSLALVNTFILRIQDPLILM